jgi:type II secretion system (T2SS) protein E
MKLGSWLIARGKITGVQLKRALLDQSFYGGHLSSSLLKLGYLDEPTLGVYLSDLFQAPYVGTGPLQKIPPEVIRMIPEHLAQKHQMVPLAVEGKKLRLAMMNPGDILVMDEVAFLTGLQVEPYVSSENHLLDALERYYQIPRSTRETIPLADQVEGRQDPRTARRQLMEASDTSEPPSLVPPTNQPASDEIGLDGRPISAASEAVSGLYEGKAPPASAGSPLSSLPRSMEEWREPSESSGAPASGDDIAPPAAPAAPLPSESALPPVREASRPAGGPQASTAIPPGRRPVLSLVPNPSSVSLEQTSERLKNSMTRDEVFEAMLDFCAGRFARSAVFLVTQNKVVGFGGRGDGFDPSRIRSVAVGMETPSIFSHFLTGSEFYYGPVPGLPANQQFYRGLGIPPPERILLVPVQIKERLIALVYGDLPVNRREDPDIALYRRLVQKAVLALEILILKNKIAMI